MLGEVSGAAQFGGRGSRSPGFLGGSCWMRLDGNNKRNFMGSKDQTSEEPRV